MAEIKYKEYTPEEDRIYCDAMAQIQAALGNGMKFMDACNSVSVENAELRHFITDDALKMQIADLYFVKGNTLADIAARLEVPLHVIEQAHIEMYQDIGISSSEMYRAAGGPPVCGTA